jgi:hypothetical protein
MLSQSRLAFDFAVLSLSCPYCYPFIALVFGSTSLSRVWVANVRPAVVLFYNLALLVLRLILFPPLFYVGRRHPPNIIYIS